MGETGDGRVHPRHYRGDTGIEAIDVIEAWGLNFSLGCVVKYVCRVGVTGDTTDLKKAASYLQREIARREIADG